MTYDGLIDRSKVIEHISEDQQYNLFGIKLSQSTDLKRHVNYSFCLVKDVRGPLQLTAQYNAYEFSVW